MLQVHVESTKNDKIYRKLQIDEEQTLFQLDFILVTAFDLFEFEDYYFFIQTEDGEQFVELLEIGDEPMANWLADVGDELIYAADKKYEVRLRVELVTDERLVADRCIAGDGNLLTNRKKKLNLEDINDSLLLKPILTADTEQLLLPDFEALLGLSSELNTLKPWHDIENDQIFSISLEEEEARFFISIMGAGGSEFGMLMFDDELGYATLAEILTGQEPSEDFHLNFTALSVNFVDRQELEKEDYALIKDAGFTFRGRKNWPQFRSYFAGNVPDLPDYEEVEIMKLLLIVVLEIVGIVKSGKPLPTFEPSVYPAFSIDSLAQTITPYVLKVSNQKKRLIEIDVNDLERAQFKRKQKSMLQLEFELFYLPYPVIDEDGERPYYPIVCIVMDRMTGEILTHDVMPFPKVSFTQQQVFWKLMLELPVRPDKVFVTKSMKEIVAPLAKLLNVELVVSELPNIQEFKEYMMNMSLDGEH